MSSLGELPSGRCRVDAKRLFFRRSGKLWEDRPGSRKRVHEGVPHPQCFKRLKRGCDVVLGRREASERVVRKRKWDAGLGSHLWDKLSRQRMVLSSDEESGSEEGHVWRVAPEERAGRGTQPIGT